jgi:hypothetical protein
MKDARIFEQILLKDSDGKTISKFAILQGGLNSDNPTQFINEITCKYWGDALANQFIDIKLNNPWTRVIISGIDKLLLENFDSFLLKRDRLEKLKKINEKS